MYARGTTCIQEISLENPAAPELTRIWEPLPDHMLMHMALSPDGTRAYVSDFEGKSGPAVVRVLNLESSGK